jgi:hypothetical protein
MSVPFDGLGSLFPLFNRELVFGGFLLFVFERELAKHRVPAQKMETGTRQTLDSRTKK